MADDAPPLQVPVVDMDALLGKVDDMAFAKERATLVDAFRTLGVAYLQFGEGTRDDLREVVDAAFDASRVFFRKPLCDKLRVVAAQSLPAGVTRGYLASGSEAGGNAPEHKEAFSWTFERTPSLVHALQHPNVWPDDNLGEEDDHLRPSLVALLDFLERVMNAVVSTVDVDLSSLCRNADSVSFARAFHYLSRATAPTDATGSAAHTDWGLATLVVQEAGSESLQAFVGDEWRTIVGKADCLVVNCSDYLSLLWDGVLHSPLHRVVLTDEERWSFVYFQYPPFNAPFPDLARVPPHVLDSLSLLKDQTHGAATPSRDVLASPAPLGSFGRYIADKWLQVSR